MFKKQVTLNLANIKKVTFILLLIVVSSNFALAQETTTSNGQIKNLTEEERALLLEEEKLVKQALIDKENLEKKSTSTVSEKPVSAPVATPIKMIQNIVATPPPTVAPVSTPVIESAPPISPTAKIVISSNKKSETINTNTEKVETQKNDPSLEEANKKIASLKNQLDEAKSRLLIAETQVARLQKIIDQRSSSDISSLAQGRRAPLRTSPPLTVIRKENPEIDPDVASLGIQDDSHNLIPAAKVESDQELPIATVMIAGTVGRTGPSSSESILTTLEQGIRLPVETKQGEWLRVITPTGARVWIPKNSVSFSGRSYNSNKISDKNSNLSSDPLEESTEDDFVEIKETKEQTKKSVAKIPEETLNKIEIEKKALSSATKKESESSAINW